MTKILFFSDHNPDPLKHEFHVTRVNQMSQIDDFNLDLFHLVIVDLSCAEGPMFLERYRSDGRLMMPLIALSSERKDEMMAIEAGADVFLSLPVDPKLLSLYIRNLRNRSLRYERLAFRDGLTGCFNRRFFDHQIDIELERVRRYSSPISLAMIDCDHFKKINDTYGHHVGDLVLQGVAQKVQSHLRHADILCRYGGEEFVIIMPNTTSDEGMNLLNRILNHFRNDPVSQHEGEAYFVTFSAGVAQYEHGMSKEEWIKAADDAAYQAKREGRNRVVLGGRSHISFHSERKKRILIAHQDKTVRQMVLSVCGMFPDVEPMEAIDGKEVYDLLHKHHFFVILAESTLPKFDGFGILNLVKTDLDFQSKCRIFILLSRWDRQDDVVKAVAKGADDFLLVPFSPVDLEMRLQQYFEGGEYHGE